MSDLRGTYAISDGKVLITGQLRPVAPSTIAIEFYVNAVGRIFYRYAGAGRRREPSPLKLLPIFPSAGAGAG
ncbi:MAG: hypothetical protein KAY22_19065 [Rhizorhabdus sp.]|uniref:hypothetical protein n=1 Tax=Rhizorhabdus sp. TaxID=1968843 RepID=UPI001B64B287|nr:hypothetical protein [Rhizorhabdus sp.]MBP8234399.1 hypothetical protein [Rhizorhabdus sp.]